MLFLRSAIVLSLLTACTSPVPDVVTGGSIHTGRSFAFAKPQMIYRDQIATVFATPSVTTTGRQAHYVILVSVRRDDLNYPKITEAWSYGARLTYAKDDRRRNFCNPACAREELGIITLTRAAFDTYAQTGFAFQLLGKRGSYDGTISAAAFARVLLQLRTGYQLSATRPQEAPHQSL